MKKKAESIANKMIIAFSSLPESAILAMEKPDERARSRGKSKPVCDWSEKSVSGDAGWSWGFKGGESKNHTD